MNTTLLHSHIIQRDGQPSAQIDVFAVTEEGEQKQQLQIIATVNGKTHEHRLLVGSEGHPLPDAYDLAQLERDIEAAKQHAIAMVDGHDRSAGLVEQWMAKKKAEVAQ